VGYPGGKAGAGVYQTIVNQIPPHSCYLEPFAGDAAIFRRKRPAARNVLVELDPAQAGALAAELGDSAELHNCCGIEWLKHAFGLHLVGPPNGAAVDQAALAARSGGARSRGGRSTPGAVAASNGGARGILTHNNAAAAGDAALGGQVPGAWFCLCDPPYVMSTRSTQRPLYRCEMTEAQHVDLLRVVNLLPCYVMLCGYDSKLYRDALDGWRTISYTSMTRGGKLGREMCWLNYPEPSELHDYRFLGRHKRERERITRKVRTWTAGLQRLPALERQAIVAGIVGQR